MKPIDAAKKSNENIVRNNLYNFKITNKKPKFSIGDRVRVSLLKNTFEKSYTSNYSQEIFIIDDIKTSNVHYYFLKDNIIYKYMTWFKQISVKEYDNLIKNKNKMYNITPHFSSVELLNKYRNDDDNINKIIEIDENLNKQNENLAKEIDKI